jgi:hypothetical protein
MKQPRSFFELFYFQLILRDLFGKIVPGFALLSSVAFSLSPSKAFLAYNALSAGLWIVLLSASWTIGHALQAFGESRGWILHRPERVNVNIGFTREMIFYQIATIEEKWTYQRFTAIKEACGIGCLVLSLSLLILAISSLIRALQNKSMLPIGDILVIILIAVLAVGTIWYLRHMHKINYDRESEWIEESLRLHRPEWLRRLDDLREKGLITDVELEWMQGVIPNYPLPHKQ